MTRYHTRRSVLRLTGSGIALATAGCIDSDSGGPDPADEVEEHRSELEPLGDVATALDREYRTMARYVRTDAGVLGEPLRRPTSGEPTETEPDIVTFDLAEDGTYEPLALKWYVPEEEADGTPSLFGRSFDGPVESRTGRLPRHYYLHVWLFRENPDGLFARYNPAVERPSFLGDLETARAALDPYTDSNAATAAGYENPETCVSTEEGNYGVPFVKDPSGNTDLSNPPILRYHLTPDWYYVRLGAEWFVPADSTDEPPELFGQSFHEPVDSHLPETGQPRHYGLHAWLFRTNPRGMFAPYSPTTSC